MKKNKSDLPLAKMFKECVKGTNPRAKISLKSIHFCSLTKSVKKGSGISNEKVFMSSISLKHIYDKRPAGEFDLILKHLPRVVKYPDRILENKPGRRGDVCFVKKIDKEGTEIACMLEKVIINETEEFQVVTACIRRKNYLNDCKLVWSWKGDKPSS